MADYYPWRFEAPIERHAVSTVRYTVVYLPPAIAAELPLAEHPRLRIEADVAGATFFGAWQPSRGTWYLMLPKAVLRELGVGVGDVVEVCFRLAPQDHVAVPDELAAALARDAAARRGWRACTPGTQRGFAHRVASAKRAETRAARVAEVLTMLREGRRYRTG